MVDSNKFMEPNRKGFDSDPFGYSALARHKRGMAQTIAGYPVDITKPATSEELKDPTLWLSQAHALAQAAVIVLKNEPELKVMPESIRGACDSQYCAVGLMLAGYSLEACLKAMIIMKNGIDEFIKIEKKHRHHRLQNLANFVPDLSSKDKAILTLLTHFVYWAGRYPDPGSDRVDDAEDIFVLSEKYKISAKDLFMLSSRIMNHANIVAEGL